MGARFEVSDRGCELASTTEAQRARSITQRCLCVSVVHTMVCFLLIGVLSGCGYVQVKITASPVPPTPTDPVRLVTPQRRATATIVPSTPLPTATATATPTPIVHVVQKGDNLLAIAYEYNVDVQALIEINEIENPRALQVGQELIIPPDDASLLTRQPTATPTPMPLRVINMAFHRTPVGSLWYMGEVENDRDESLDLVQIQVSLYNTDGELIEQVTSFTAADVVPGHGKAPFAVLIPPASAARYASHQVVVLSAEPITHWGRRHRALTVEQVEGEMSKDTFVAQGIVHNQSNVHAKGVRVTLTAYGDDGTVVGVRQVDVDQLAANERQTFSLSLVPAAPVVRVEAVAWGIKESP